MRRLEDPDFAARFWAQVDQSAPDGCWPWAGRRQFGTHEYGQTHVDGRTQVSHRIAYQLTQGEIAPGLEVCHSCDNPPCCNPTHLFLGTHQENMRDAGRKGKMRGARGEKRFPQLAATPEGRCVRLSLTMPARQVKLARETAAARQVPVSRVIQEAIALWASRLEE